MIKNYQEILTKIMEEQGGKIYYFTERMESGDNWKFKYQDVPTISFSFMSKRLNEITDGNVYRYFVGYAIKSFADKFHQRKAYRLCKNRLYEEPLTFIVNFDDVFPHNITYENIDEVRSIVNSYIKMRLAKTLVDHVSQGKVFEYMNKRNPVFTNSFFFLEILEHTFNKEYLRNAGYHLI